MGMWRAPSTWTRSYSQGSRTSRSTALSPCSRRSVRAAPGLSCGTEAISELEAARLGGVLQGGDVGLEERAAAPGVLGGAGHQQALHDRRAARDHEQPAAHVQALRIHLLV